jgi:phosphohistidine swiveling domain-containing protein
MEEKILRKIIEASEPWILAEDIPDVDFHFTQIFLSSFVNDMEKTVGINYKQILSTYHGHNLKFYYGEKDSQYFSEHVLKLIVKNPKFGDKINKKIKELSKKFKLFCKKIESASLRNISNKELGNLHKKLDTLHTELYTWGWLPNAVDMFHNNFTNYLKKILRKKLSVEDVNGALVTFSASLRKSVIQEEYESFLRLVTLKQRRASERKIKYAAEKHLSKYFYLKHLWLGKEGVYDYSYYIHEINKFIKSGKDAKNILTEENKNFSEKIRERNQLFKKLKLDKKTIQLFDVYSEFAVTKLIRRDAQIYWAYKMTFFFSELGQRLKIPEKLARFMLPIEIYEGLENGKLDNILRKELKKRAKYCVYYAEKNNEYIFTDKEAGLIEKKISQQKKEISNELKGQTACLGKAIGKVKIVNLISEMNKMRQGDILVSIATNPDIVPAMKKASAIVTEQGGITSHAAIVSREMRIPCIIGVKNATKVLCDGDLVEVDANKELVKIIRKNKKS